MIIRGIEKRAIFQDQPDYEDFLKGKNRHIAEARGLFCHWCRQELGLSLTALARMLSLTPAAVVYAARRGERFAADSDLLIES